MIFITRCLALQVQSHKLMPTLFSHSSVALTHSAALQRRFSVRLFVFEPRYWGRRRKKHKKKTKRQNKRKEKRKSKAKNKYTVAGRVEVDLRYFSTRTINETLSPVAIFLPDLVFVAKKTLCAPATVPSSASERVESC